MGRRRKQGDIFLDPSGIIFQESNHRSFYTKGKPCGRKFLGVGNSVGTYFFQTKIKGLDFSSNPLI
jgi:hypothetical protein